MEFKGIRMSEDKQTLSQAEQEKQIQAEAEAETTEDNVDKVETTVETKEESKETFEINDEHVLSHIKTKFGKEINSIDELFKQPEQVELDADVAAFDKFKKETGRGLSDFMKLNRDFSSEDPDRVLAEFYKETQSHLDDDDIRFKLNKFSFDEDLATDEEIHQKKLEKKEEVKKAIDYFESQKEKYKAPLESSDSFVPQEERESYNAFKQYKSSQEQIEQEDAQKRMVFDEKTNALLNDSFEGFEVSIGDEKFKYKPSDAATLKQNQASIVNFIKQFVDDNGVLTDAAKYHRAIAVASDPEKFAKHFMELGEARAIEARAKESKGVKDVKEVTQVTPQKTNGFRVVDSEGDKKYIIKKKQ